MKFGRSDCSEIEIEQFEPICSHPQIDGTTPLTLDVPVPSFVTPVPPNECACFDFVSKKANTVVVNECETSEQPKCTVEITQENKDDCCTGRYVITPTVEIPCMPFSISKADVTVSNRSGDGERGVDGSVQVSIDKGCCSIDTTIAVELPDCIKGYKPEAIPVNQIQYCKREEDGHVSRNVHKLVDLVADADNCSLYPEIHPIELPCCTHPDGIMDSGVFDLDKRGSNIKWELKRTDCDISLGIEPTIVDCACFNFTPKKSPVTITPCNRSGSISVEIVKEEGTDCCEGQFTIEPSVSIPCIPFEIADAKVDVHDRYGGKNVGGKISVSVDKECCTLTPIIDAEFPVCIPHYTVPPEVQIKYLDHGVQKWHKLLTVEEHRDECFLDTTIDPLDLPCPLKDWSKSGKSKLSNAGGEIEWSIEFVECQMDRFEIKTTPINIPDIIPPCLSPTDMCVQFKHRDKKGNEKTSEQQTIHFNVEPGNPCPRYVPKTDGSGCCTFDLGTIGGGGGAGFANGGDVNISTGAGPDPILCIDGKPNEDAETWYGGGYGDYVNNKNYKNTFRRGPIMRGGVESPGVVFDPRTGEVLYNSVTVSVDGTAKSEYVKPTEDGTDSVSAGTYWQSGRSSTPDGESNDAVQQSVSIDEEDTGTTETDTGDEEEVEVWPWSSTANLNLVWPTGAQWHKRGIALTLTEFEFNDSGVLSFTEEKQEALVVAPGPALLKKEDPTVKNVNASGLRIYSELFEYDDGEGHTFIYDEFDRVAHGLRVDVGDGLRIYGTGDGSVDPADVDDTRQGVVEIMYGPGLKIINDPDLPDSDSGKYLDMPVNIPGAIVPNDGKGLHIYGVTKKIAGKSYTEKSRLNKLEVYTFDHDIHIVEKEGEVDDRLVFNDKYAYDDWMWEEGFGEDPPSIHRFNRTEDMAVPMVIADPYISGDAWMATENGYFADTEYMSECVVSCKDKASSAISNLQAVLKQMDNVKEGEPLNQYLLKTINAIIQGLQGFTSAATATGKITTLLSGIGVTGLHIGKAGIILGTDGDTEYSAQIKRRAEGEIEDGEGDIPPEEDDPEE